MVVPVTITIVAGHRVQHNPFYVTYSKQSWQHYICIVLPQRKQHSSARNIAFHCTAFKEFLYWGLIFIPTGADLHKSRSEYNMGIKQKHDDVISMTVMFCDIPKILTLI